MSKPSTIKDAIKKWEDKNPGANITDATEVGFQFQWPPIEKMDNSLSALTSCRKLSLSSNMIEKISGLGGLKNLKILSLARNYIKSFAGLEPLADTLEELWISYNSIEKIKGVNSLKKLKVLYMSNNIVKDWAEFNKLQELPLLEDLLFIVTNYDGYYTLASFTHNDGVAIYTRHNIAVSYTIYKYYEVTFSRLIFEKHNTLNGLTYHRPPLTSVDLFIRDLSYYLANIQVEQVELIIGDMNINLCDLANPVMLKYLNTLDEYNFRAAISKATRVISTTKSCIDHVFTRVHATLHSSQFFSNTYILQNSITDHYSTFTQLQAKTPSHMMNQIGGKSKCNNNNKIINYCKYVRLCTKENWNIVLDSEDINFATNPFINIIKTNLNNSEDNKFVIHKKAMGDNSYCWCD